MKPKQINNLTDLRLERVRLKIQLATKEDQLEDSWVYFKDNYKGMIWEQINPFKNSSLFSTALGLLQPSLLPVLTEVVKGTVKGSPINGKVIGSTIKFAIANLGIKWLRKWLDDKEEIKNESVDTFEEGTEEEQV